jgi:putative hydrolase of HD superfamily
MSDVVDRVLAALNAGDLDAFVECYAADATIEDGYDNVVARGHVELRAKYGPMFERFPDVRVTAGWRTTVGDFVVEEETVTGRGEAARHVAIYLIAGDVIARERLVS